MNNRKRITKLVHDIKTKHKIGFNQTEQTELLKKFPDINLEKYNDALMGITCSRIDGEILIYHCDIITALLCGIENRNMNMFEFD